MSYTESPQSWRKRLEAELKEALDYVENKFGLDDPWHIRHSIALTRKSLEKCQMYVSEIETDNENTIRRADILQRAGQDET